MLTFSNVDYINLMTYDFHANAQWDRTAGFNLYFNAPYADASGRDSIQNGLQIFLNSAPSSKLIVGLPLYGNAYVTSGSNAVQAAYSTQSPSIGVNPSYNSVNYYNLTKRLKMSFTLNKIVSNIFSIDLQVDIHDEGFRIISTVYTLHVWK